MYHLFTNHRSVLDFACLRGNDPRSLIDMAKRSREASFSPAAQDTHSPSAPSEMSDETEDLPPGKVAALDECPVVASQMQCPLPPHREAVTFATIQEYEIHYAKDHTNRCSSCGRNFPSAHFLALHIDENHNPLRDLAQAQGERTYACFVEDCERKCSTPQKRRLHLIDKHMFPKAYNFRIVNSGIDNKSTTMLQEGRRRRISTADDKRHTLTSKSRSSRGERSHSHAQANGTVDRTRPNSSKTAEAPLLATQTEKSRKYDVDPTKTHVKDSPTSATDVDDLSRSMSALRFIPASVTKRQAANKTNT